MKRVGNTRGKSQGTVANSYKTLFSLIYSFSCDLLWFFLVFFSRLLSSSSSYPSLPFSIPLFSCLHSVTFSLCVILFHFTLFSILSSYFHWYNYLSTHSALLCSLPHDYLLPLLFQLLFSFPPSSSYSSCYNFSSYTITFFSHIGFSLLSNFLLPL